MNDYYESVCRQILTHQNGRPTAIAKNYLAVWQHKDASGVTQDTVHSHYRSNFEQYLDPLVQEIKKDGDFPWSLRRIGISKRQDGDHNTIMRIRAILSADTDDLPYSHLRSVFKEWNSHILLKNGISNWRFSFLLAIDTLCYYLYSQTKAVDMSAQFKNYYGWVDRNNASESLTAMPSSSLIQSSELPKRAHNQDLNHQRSARSVLKVTPNPQLGSLSEPKLLADLVTALMAVNDSLRERHFYHACMFSKILYMFNNEPEPINMRKQEVCKSILNLLCNQLDLVKKSCSADDGNALSVIARIRQDICSFRSSGFCGSYAVSAAHSGVGKQRFHKWSDAFYNDVSGAVDATCARSAYRELPDEARLVMTRFITQTFPGPSQTPEYRLSQSLPSNVMTYLTGRLVQARTAVITDIYTLGSKYLQPLWRASRNGLMAEYRPSGKIEAFFSEFWNHNFG